MPTWNVELSFIAAAIIGVVVSLDVGGLLISQHADFRNRRNGAIPAALKSATLHAAVHAGFFLLYFYLVSLSLKISIDFPDFIIGLLEYLKYLPPLDLKEVAKTTLLLSSLVVIVFVWVTYAGKIVEDHSTKLKETGNPLEGSRIDIQLVYQLSKFFVKRHRGRIRAALACAVAIDMLAITSFIRVYFRGALDTAKANAAIDGTLPHFNFGVAEAWDPLIFSGVLFPVVFLCALFAILFSTLLDGERHLRVLTWLRVLEPFCVFWILVVSIDHLFGFPIERPFHLVVKIVLGGLVSVALTYLMVRMRTFAEIKKAVARGSNVILSEIEDNREPAEFIKDPGLRRSIKRTAIAISLFFLALILTFYMSHQRPANGHPMTGGSGLLQFISMLSLEMNFIVILIIYTPLRRISEWEMAIDNFLFATSKRDNVNRVAFLCSYAAYFLVLLYIHVSYVGFNVLTLHPDEVFLVSLVCLGVLLFAAWCLATFRATRRRELARLRGDELGATLSINDGLSAFAVVIFLFQIWLQFGVPSAVTP